MISSFIIAYVGFSNWLLMIVQRGNHTLAAPYNFYGRWSITFMEVWLTIVIEINPFSKFSYNWFLERKKNGIEFNLFVLHIAVRLFRLIYWACMYEHPQKKLTYINTKRPHEFSLLTKLLNSSISIRFSLWNKWWFNIYDIRTKNLSSNCLDNSRLN
jgi:hypothetical protein